MRLFVRVGVGKVVVYRHDIYASMTRHEALSDLWFTVITSTGVAECMFPMFSVECSSPIQSLVIFDGDSHPIISQP